MRKSLNLDALQNSAMVVSMENEEVHPLQRAKSDMVRPVTRRTHRRGSNSDGDGSEMVVPTKIIPLSDHTIRLIEAMDDGQVDNALAAFEEMKTKRRESNLITTARASRRKLKGFDLCDFDVVDDDEDRKTDDVFFQRGGLKKILDSDKPTVVNTIKSESELDPNFTTESAPKRRPPRERRQTLHRSLISTERNDFDLGCEAHSGRLDKPNNCSAEKSSLGLQAFLGKITGAFHHQEDVKPKKQLDGPALFRKGKRKADKCLFLEAVALFNFALEKQRETLGEDHLDCATTLNEIGNAWMILGERYSALTAYEEALYIRQKGLGPGALEVAETTNNIWMILHEQRCEMEEEMNEGNDEYSA